MKLSAFPCKKNSELSTRVLFLNKKQLTSKAQRVLNPVELFSTTLLHSETLLSFLTQPHDSFTLTKSLLESQTVFQQFSLPHRIVFLQEQFGTKSGRLHFLKNIPPPGFIPFFGAPQSSISPWEKFDPPQSLLLFHSISVSTFFCISPSICCCFVKTMCLPQLGLLTMSNALFLFPLRFLLEGKKQTNHVPFFCAQTV